MTRKLDLIITHYGEDWEVVRPFFDMLGVQREIDWSEVGVILIHDGPGLTFPFTNFTRYPFIVEQISIEHGGVSAARNTGIELSNARWISFCDCDDMFETCHSLWRVMRLLDTEDYDILCGTFAAEHRTEDGGYELCAGKQPDSVFVHAKYFRTDFIREHGLKFPEGQEFNEDSAFVTIAYTETRHERVGIIETDGPIYLWRHRADSSTKVSDADAWKPYAGGWRRNRAVCEAYKKRLSPERYRAMVSRTIYDAYYHFNLATIPTGLEPYRQEFLEWLTQHMADFEKCSPEWRRETALAAKRQHDTGDNEARVRRGGTAPLLLNRNRDFSTWLRDMTAEAERRQQQNV